MALKLVVHRPLKATVCCQHQVLSRKQKSTCLGPLDPKIMRLQIGCFVPPSFVPLPLGNLAKAKENQSSKIFVVKGANKWLITAPKQLSKFEANQPGSLVPFWWVKLGEEANMEYSMLQQDGFKIPILQNCQSIAANSPLLLPNKEAEQEPDGKAEEEPQAPEAAAASAKAKEKAKAKAQTEAPASSAKKPRKK